MSDRWFHRVWFRAGLRIPIEVFAGPCDLYHATDFVLPPVRKGTRTVLTVHDLSFERDPASAVPSLLAFLRRVVPDSARRAGRIVADSHATARDLTALYGVPPEKITTVHSGVESRFFGAEGDASIAQSPVAVRAKYGIADAPFVLTVGTLQKRKNHLTLVRAFAQVAGDARAERLNLVVCGGRGWLYDDVLAEVRRLGIEERVRFIGFADDADLPALYRAAAAFAFPSVYEGFGLPVLEAMAAGTPAVASNASSLPEIVGDAGLLHDPLDVEALAAGLRLALFDDAYRAAIIPRAVARARTFTWQRAARDLLAVYEAALAPD